MNRFCVLLIMLSFVVTARAQDCTIFVDNADLYNATINGSVFYDNQGDIVINNNYHLPTEKIRQISELIQVFQNLADSLKRQQLTIKEEEALLIARQEAYWAEQDQLNEAYASLSEQKHDFDQIQKAFKDELAEVKNELEAVTHQQTEDSTSSPIENKIKELTITGKRLLENTEKCLTKDYELKLLMTSDGAAYFGFSLADIRNDPNYVFIDDYFEGYARVKRNNKYGFYDQKGSLVIDFKYDFADRFADGKLLVYNLRKWSILDREEKVIYEFNNDVEEVYRLHVNAYLVRIGTKQQILDLSDISSPQIRTYDKIYPFRDKAVTLVARGDTNFKYGLLDQSGKEVVPVDYDTIQLFHQYEVAIATNRVKYRKKKRMYNYQGLLLSDIYDDIVTSETDLFLSPTNLIMVKKGVDWGLIRLDGTIVFNCQYENIKVQSDYLQLQEWQNEPVPQDPSQNRATQGHNRYKPPTLYLTLANLHGNVIVKARNCKAITPWHADSLFLVESRFTTKKGIINQAGKVVIPIKYDSILNMNRFGLIEVKQLFQLNADSTWYDVGLVNIKGEEIIEPYYKSISRFSDLGFATVWDSYSRCSLIDTSGTFILKDFEDILPPTVLGLVIVKEVKQGKYGVVNFDHELVVDYLYDQIEHFDEASLAIARKDYARGVINKNGLEVIPFMFDRIKGIGHEFECGLNGEIFVIDRTGRCTSANSERYKKLVKLHFEARSRK